MEYQITNLNVQSMTYLDSRNALIVLSSGQHKLYLINTAEDHVSIEISTDFENITDDFMISNMLVRSVTAKFIAEKYPHISDFNDECMLVFSLDNGNILTCLLRFEPSMPLNNSPASFKSA